MLSCELFALTLQSVVFLVTFSGIGNARAIRDSISDGYNNRTCMEEKGLSQATSGVNANHPPPSSRPRSPCASRFAVTFKNLGIRNKNDSLQNPRHYLAQGANAEATVGNAEPPINAPIKTTFV